MAKKTFYYSNPKRMLSGFLNDLAAKDIEQTNKKIKEMIQKKKAKLRELYINSSHQILQPNMNPTRRDYGQFTTITPAAVGQEFISEKIKANVLTPQRFYTCQTNVKAGALSQPKKWSLPEDRLVVNKKFEEYNRIVDDQSGTIKHQRLSKFLSSYNPEEKKQKKFSRMKKTYFQKFIADKYNFYKPPAKRSVGLESTSILKKSRSRVLDTMDTRQSRQYPLELKKEMASLSYREPKMTDIQDAKSQRSQQRNRSITLNGKTRLKTIVQKNMDSLA